MLDFDKDFAEFVAGGEGSAIKDIYNIIPALTQEQLMILHSLEFFIEKYDLPELERIVEQYKKSMVKNKNLDFLKTMQVKNLLSAYNLDRLVSGIKVTSHGPQQGE